MLVDEFRFDSLPVATHGDRRWPRPVALARLAATVRVDGDEAVRVLREELGCKVVGPIDGPVQRASIVSADGERRHVSQRAFWRPGRMVGASPGDKCPHRRPSHNRLSVVTRPLLT